MSRLREIILANDARYQALKRAGKTLVRPAWLASPTEPWPPKRPLWMAPERPKPSRKSRSSKPPEQPDPGAESL